MKKILLSCILLTSLLILLGSCETGEDTCKQCRIVTYEDNVVVSEGTPETYCGSQLQNVEGQTSTVGNMTTVMVCQ